MVVMMMTMMRRKRTTKKPKKQSSKQSTEMGWLAGWPRIQGGERRMRGRVRWLQPPKRPKDRSDPKSRGNKSFFHSELCGVTAAHHRVTLAHPFFTRPERAIPREGLASTTATSPPHHTHAGARTSAHSHAPRQQRASTAPQSLRWCVCVCVCAKQREKTTKLYGMSASE